MDIAVIAGQRRALAPTIVEWAVWAVVAVAITAVSISTHAALYAVAVPLAFLLGALQGGSILLALIRPRIAAILHLLALVVLAVDTSAASGPWPISVLGVIALSALLVVLGARARWTVAAATWGVAMSALLIVLVAVAASGGDVGGADVMMIVAASVTLFVLMAVLGAVQLIAARQEVEEVREESLEQRTLLLSSQERSRIAREMHDVVAHGMSLVYMRATSARYRLRDMSEETAAEFDGIAEDARAALREMRGLLGVLRTEGEVFDAPQPDVGQLGVLVASTRAAGVTVTDRLEEIEPIPPAATQLALYRVAQEALSNVIRHAPGAEVEITLGVDGDDVVLMVRNSRSVDVGARGRLDEGGQGIRGMMERMASVGGILTHGPVGDGYVVVARAPRASGAVE